MSKPYVCPACGEPCNAIECDRGIGPYEVHGLTGRDGQPYMGSDCCEAELEGVDFPEPKEDCL